MGIIMHFPGGFNGDLVAKPFRGDRPMGKIMIFLGSSIHDSSNSRKFGKWRRAF